VQVLGISMDSIEANAAFARKYRFPYRLLSDTSGQVCRAYGACSEAGEIRRNTIVIGPDSRIRRIFEDVKPEGHVETVLAFLKAAAMAGAPRYQPPHVNLRERQNLSTKGGQTRMKDQQQAENGAVYQASPLDRPDPPPGIVGEGQVASVTTSGVTQPELFAAAAASPPSIRPSRCLDQFSSGGAALAAATPMDTLPDRSSQTPPAVAKIGPSLVFALGTLDIDFGTEARRDSIAQHMASPENPTPNPEDPAQLLRYLEANPDQASSVIWVLFMDATPIYAVLPNGPFASMGYERLRQFIQEQVSEGVERVSIAGVIAGHVRLMSGQSVPIIYPELRCMYSWSTAALVEVAAGEPPDDSAESREREAHGKRAGAVTNFLERIYHDLRNLGITPQDRALNYAATNALIAAGILEAALKEEMQLDTIEVEASPICRLDSECLDVVLCFFDPENVLRSRKCHRFTVDVSDVCPVIVGKVRSWSMR
jgi:cyanobactin maturation PatA/PatG family protease